MAADEESKILILPESHEGKLVTKLSNDQLKVLTCRITIDPKDQSKEVHKYKEVYEIDADARIPKSEDMMCITRVEISSLQPKPVTELLHTIERRSTTLSAAPLFTSDVNEDEDNNSNGFGTKAWFFFSRLCTLFLPDSLLCYVGNNIKEEGGMSESQANELRLVKQAWREKIALCVIMASSSLGFLFVCLVLPTYILGCGKATTANMGCTFFDRKIVDYSLCVIIGVVLSVQCVASFIQACKKKPIITEEVTSSKVLVAMPCYNEGFKELNKTIKSVTDTTYPDDNKCLIAIADGQITGKGEPASTPQILGRILGYESDEVESHNAFHKYTSVGTITENYAQLHYGTSAKGLKYLVIEKVGTSDELDSPRAGNRGKRDSLVIMMGLLNRVHYGKKLQPLDIAIIDALDYLQISIDDCKYLLAIDADTRISKESISYMSAAMKDDDDILALCGDTKVDNKTQSWVTGLQVFEYYQSHHMKKAFEAMFGCVTCLPGCFTMYRLSSNEGQPLISADYVYNKYSTNKVESLHEKNLFHLGEDRYLTTLLLLKFSDMKLSFVPEATCHTIVPNTFSVLLSQRRRWINSTFHNMIELLRVNTMCGICCLSMRSIVVLDLISTFVLPASLLYFGYLCVRALAMEELPPLMLLTTIGLTLLVHILIFLIRRRWDYWWWLVVYCLGVVPVFYFILPLYSFYHMDDFTWGSTRQVGGGGNLTRQKGVRHLDIDKSDTDIHIDITDDDLDELDDDLKKIFAIGGNNSTKGGVLPMKTSNTSTTLTLSSMSSDKSSSENEESRKDTMGE